MTPVDRIARLVGGFSRLAALCGVHPAQVSRWRRRKGGVIPAWHYQNILDRSAGRVTPQDFFEPTSVESPSERRAFFSALVREAREIDALGKHFRELRDFLAAVLAKHDRGTRRPPRALRRKGRSGS